MRWMGLLGLLLLVGAVIPGDATTPDLLHRLAGPSLTHPLGTDHLGRDVLTRLAAGTRLSVGFALLAVSLCTLIGTLAGTAAGYLGGVLARLMLHTIDILVAIPAVVVGLALAAVLRPGIPALLIAVIATGWMPFARIAYQLTVQQAGAGYVTSAVALGCGTGWVLSRHILPNTAPPLLAHACLRFAHTLLAIAGLSFLGLGAPPPTPEWGAMLAEGRQYLFLAPRLVLVPAIAIVLVTLATVRLGRTLERRWAVDRAA
jgi:peptide/nickel transport system permease protein